MSLIMKKYILNILLIPFFITGCFEEEIIPDASGNFEAVEVTVSAENSGKILHFNINEGDFVNEGKLIGIIDTTQQHLQLKQILASIVAMKKKEILIESQTNIYLQQYQSTEKEYIRFNNLLKSNAVTEKQVDDIKAQLDLIKKQIESTETQKIILNSEIKTQDIQTELIKEQLNKSYIKSPINGNILLKIVEEDEFVTIGAPLFKIANTDNLILRAYISGNQLSSIKIGDIVEIKIDSFENEFESYSGKITWISSESEFTPKAIQTKEERVKLVYAIKIEVKNDGKIKIGMPGDVYFKAQN